MIIDAIAREIRNTTYANPDKWFLDWFNGGQESEAGVNVGPQSALHYAPYFQGINLISGDIGKIPLPVLKKSPEGRERDVRHPAYSLMMFEFNDLMTADVGKQLLQSWTLGWGNGRAAILRAENSDPQALIPLLPDRTECKLVDGELWHITRIGESQEPRAYRDENVLHIKGLGFDGITGYSIASMARNTLGLGMGAEKYASRTLKNNAVPPMVLETDGRLSEKDAKQLLHDFNAYHGGAENPGKTGLLHSGVKAHLLGMPAKDMEFVSLWGKNRIDVASWFNLPPHKLNSQDQPIGYNGLQEMENAYRTGCLLFWFVRWQLECRRKLLREREKAADSHYFEFFVDMLASVNFGEKVEALNKLVASTVFSPNEAREKLNMNKREGGDKYENPNTNSRETAKPVEPPATPAPKRQPRPTPEDIAAITRNLREQLPERLVGPLADVLGSDERLVGQSGPQGERGERGETGERGPQGDQGPVGPQGERGESGPVGPQGERGPQGEKGEQGETGRAGADGERGQDGGHGASAYAIAIASGFSGTEAEWLSSLAGKDGSDGAPGTHGRDGIDGRDGKDGEAGEPSLYGRCLDVLSAAVAREIDIVRHHAANAKNFTRWHETWYPKWQAKFAADLRRLGGEEAIAIEHCQESERQLLEFSGTVVTKDDLVRGVHTLTAAWHERAAVIARRIAGSSAPALSLELESIVSTPQGLAKVVGISDVYLYQVEFQDGRTVTMSGGDLEGIG